MNFLEKIKKDMNNPENRRGYRDKCVISASDLRQLIYHFEKLDSVHRIQDETHFRKQLQHQLHDVLDCLHLHTSPDHLMLMIMDFLSKRIKEKAKEDMTIKTYELKFPIKEKNKF